MPVFSDKIGNSVGNVPKYNDIILKSRKLISENSYVSLNSDRTHKMYAGHIDSTTDPINGTITFSRSRCTFNRRSNIANNLSTYLKLKIESHHHIFIWRFYKCLRESYNIM